MVVVTTIIGCSSGEVIKNTSPINSVKNLDFSFEVKPEIFKVSVESGGSKERKVSNFKKNKTEASGRILMKI